MPLVVVTHIGHADTFHHCSDIFGSFSDKQMDVVVHQTVGVYVTIGRERISVMLLGRGDGSEDFKEFATVLVIGKDVSAVDTA